MQYGTGNDYNNTTNNTLFFRRINDQISASTRPKYPITHVDAVRLLHLPMRMYQRYKPTPGEEDNKHIIHPPIAGKRLVKQRWVQLATRALHISQSTQQMSSIGLINVRISEMHGVCHVPGSMLPHCRRCDHRKLQSLCLPWCDHKILIMHSGAAAVYH